MKGREGMALTPKQEKFVQGLFAGLSQRKAYKEAFNAENMSDNLIDKEACILAKNSKVSVRLKELQDARAKENGWTIDKLINEFEEIKDMCKTAKPVYDYNGEPTGEYRFDSNGAVKSLENIGKLLGFYTEQIKHSGNIGVKIIDDIEDDVDDNE